MKNFHSLDIAKVIAALFVIMLHVTPFEPGLLDIIFGTFGRLAVPFFYITSAFLFFSKNPQRNNVIKYVHRMLILYGFWFVIQTPIIYIEQIQGNDDKLLALCQICWNFFTYNTYSGSYFLMALIISVPLVYFLSRRSQPLAWAIGIICYITSSLCASYHLMTPSCIEDILNIIQIPFKDIACSFCPAILYVLFGKWAAEHQETIIKSKSTPWLIIITLFTIGLYFIESLFITKTGTFGYEGKIMRMPFSRVLAAFPLFIFILNINIHKALPFSQIRKLSTIMYFSHFIFVAMVYHLYYHFTVLLHMNNLMLYLFVLISSIVTFIFMDKASKTKKFSWMKYGF